MSQLRFVWALAFLALASRMPAASAQDSPPCAFLASDDLRIGNASTIGGDLGANDPGGQVRIGRGVDMADGTIVAGDDVGVSNGASLFDVDANRFASGRGTVVRGAVGTPSLPLDDPFCPVPELSCGGPDVLVRRGDPPVVLPAGSYGDIVLENGTSLRLEPGLLQACSISARRGVEIVVSGGLASRLDVVGEFRLENGSQLIPAAGTPTPILNVGGARVRLGARARLEAFLAAPDAFVRIRHGSTVTGSICASELTTGHSVALACSQTVAPTSTSTSTSTTSSTTSPSTTTTAPSTSTTTTTASTTSSTTVSPTTTSTTSSSTTTAAPSTSTTSTTSTTTTLAPTTSTTTSTTSSTTTTQPTTIACGPNGIVARLAVPYDTRTLPALASIRFEVRYPATVAVPGNGFETDDSRLTIITGLDGSTILVDRDDDMDGTDDTFRVAYALTGGRTFPPGNFADVLLDCVAGTPIDPTAFTCGVLDAADPVGTSIPNPQSIPCGLESLTPQ